MLYVKRVIHTKVWVYLHRSIVHLNRSVCVTKLKLCTHLPLRVCALPSSDIPYGYTLACVARLNLRTGSLSYALRLTWSFLFIPARRCGRARTRDVRFCSGFRNVSCPLGVKRDGEGVVNRVSRRSLLSSPPPCVFMVPGDAVGLFRRASVCDKPTSGWNQLLREEPEKVSNYPRKIKYNFVDIKK